jgi:Clathrin adaptor complex small chain
MFHSWCWQDGQECVTSWSTKVNARYSHEQHADKADTKIVYRRYASLFFIAACDSTDNELITLEIVHRFVEQMDKYYGNVCELDIIFNFQKAYFILDELLLAGEMQESSKKNVLRCISQQDGLEDMEVSKFLSEFVWHLVFRMLISCFRATRLKMMVSQRSCRLCHLHTVH